MQKVHKKQVRNLVEPSEMNENDPCLSLTNQLVVFHVKQVFEKLTFKKKYKLKKNKKSYRKEEQHEKNLRYFCVRPHIKIVINWKQLIK